MTDRKKRASLREKVREMRTAAARARRGVGADDGRDAKVRQEEEGVARVLKHVIFTLSG
jgi:hypothetical protein